MKFFTYILYSGSLNKFYKGHTEEIDQRLKRHNAGYEHATQAGKPWILIWSAQKDTRGEAMKLESKLKNLTRERLVDFMKKYSEGQTAEGAKLLSSQKFET